MGIAFTTDTIESIEDFEYAVTRVLDADIRNAECIALRVSIPMWRELLHKASPEDPDLTEQVSRIKQRVPDKIVVVFPDGHDLARQRKLVADVDMRRLLPKALIAGENVALLSDIPANLIEEICSEDLRLAIETNLGRSALISSTTHHFVLPSGAHTSTFFRLSDALTDLRIVDRIAYWAAIAIHVSNDFQFSADQNCVVVDHPSMLLLGTRIQAVTGIPFELHAIQRYPQDTLSTKALAETLHGLWRRFTNLDLLVGIASTGTLCKLVSQVATVQQKKCAWRILFGTREIPNIDVLCMLRIPNYRHYLPSEPCELCSAGLSAVPIDGATYLFGQTPASPVAIPPKFFQLQHDFIERYGRVEGALRVHIDNQNESPPRHHAFYVDVGSLLCNATFQEELRALINGLDPKPDAFLLPDHRGSLRLGMAIKETTGNVCHVVQVSPRATIAPFLANKLALAKTIAVIDDKLISGDRFRQFNRFFREHSDQVPCLQHIHFVALLANPNSSRNYAEIQRGLTSMHPGISRSLSHLYYFPLPAWGRDNCPWCKEQGLLKALANDEVFGEGWLNDRLNRLNETSVGLSSDCYLVTSSDVVVPVLGNSSVLLPQGSTPLQVLIHCASAVQQCRTSGDDMSLSAEDFPAPRFLAVRVFKNNFDERMIWLALLRTIKECEPEPDLRRYLVEFGRAQVIARDQQQAFAIAELALSWLKGSLGQVTLGDQEFFEMAGFDWQALLKSGNVH